MPRMLALIQRCAERLTLDLSDLHVVAPATTGYQAATATLALLAGAASVTAVTRPSNRYHSAGESADVTESLAALAGVHNELRICERIDHQTCSSANILINCDPVRPITRSLIERLPDRAVIAVAGEPWTLLAGDIDVKASREHRIPVSAVNESHPDVGGTDYHPALCMKLFSAARVAVRDARVALICGNPLAGNLERGLRAAGARIVVFPRPDMVFEHAWNAVVLAQRPTTDMQLDIRDLGHLAKVAPDAVILQYWGDIDRKAARYFGLEVWPPRTPGRGRLGLPLEVLGPEPTVQLAASALKAAELVLAGKPLHPGGLAQVLNPNEWIES
ncbi:hypothetical protein [Chelativorans sp. M5D2P16]|uniref:hypothetical protein n=1 Tax=Chelativorans sp. M5D2P16 TaxID=3095678 RepID=UPI002ACA23CE|nr:hypothetical protein [Chelativorans sp. M5D2P16]MDZ5697838.1 hypothetical protein [Chelativorans sp. M5D2P16]